MTRCDIEWQEYVKNEEIQKWEKFDFHNLKQVWQDAWYAGQWQQSRIAPRLWATGERQS